MNSISIHSTFNNYFGKPRFLITSLYELVIKYSTILPVHKITMNVKYQNSLIMLLKLLSTFTINITDIINCINGKWAELHIMQDFTKMDQEFVINVNLFCGREYSQFSGNHAFLWTADASYCIDDRISLNSFHIFHCHCTF